jgi:hypothetical protein
LVPRRPPPSCTPVTAEAAVTYKFEASKPLVDGVLPVTPKTTLAVVGGHVFSAEVTATALTYSLTDATGGGGSTSGDPQTIPALTFSEQGPASDDPSPATYIMGVTRFEVARIDLIRGDDVVSVQTIANDAFPDLRFFIIADDEGQGSGIGAAIGVPLLVAYDSQGAALTDSERVLAAQRSIGQEEEERQRQEGVVAELHDVRVDSEGMVLSIRYFGCGGVPIYLAEPDSTTVRILITLPLEPPCDQGETLYEVGFTLSEPLGERAVVDDVTGQEVARRSGES